VLEACASDKNLDSGDGPDDVPEDTAGLSLLGDGAAGEHVVGGVHAAGGEDDCTRGDDNTAMVHRANRSDLRNNNSARAERLVMVVH
jgi:hypothetical protein